MVEQTNDALVPETAPLLRSLPRRAQVGLGLVLVAAILLATLLFNRENGGRGLTDPGATLPKVGDRLAALPLTDATDAPFDVTARPGIRYGSMSGRPGAGRARRKCRTLRRFYQGARTTHPDFVLLSLNTADNHQDGVTALCLGLQ